MEKLELQLIALSDSESQPGQFVVVLETLTDQRRVPIIIGKHEAQAIAVAVEQMRPTRPLTHDSWLASIQAMDAKVQEVIITQLTDGVFHASLYLRTSNEETREIDVRTSDALALAVRCHAPIYTYPSVVAQAGLGVDIQAELPKKGSLANYTLAELEVLMEKLLQKEDYQSAARIRDLIAQRKAK